MGMGSLSLNSRLVAVGGISSSKSKGIEIESKNKNKKNQIQGAVSLRVKAMAAPKFKFKYKGTQMREKQLTEMIEKKVKEAEQVCLGGGGEVLSDECKVAWDEVEEISQAKADFRLKLEKQDPLDYYCQQNPHTDECRIYDY